MYKSFTLGDQKATILVTKDNHNVHAGYKR